MPFGAQLRTEGFSATRVQALRWRHQLCVFGAIGTRLRGEVRDDAVEGVQAGGVDFGDLDIVLFAHGSGS